MRIVNFNSCNSCNSFYSCGESFVNVHQKTNKTKRMKTITSIKLQENLKVALTATGFLSLVMTLSYITWFA